MQGVPCVTVKHFSQREILPVGWAVLAQPEPAAGPCAVQFSSIDPDPAAFMQTSVVAAFFWL